MSQEPRFLPLALRDRAYAFLASRESVAEEALLAHVYGGPAPAALRRRLAEPLLGDPRLERRADGTWAAIGRPAQSTADGLRELALTTLAVVASGPNPERGRVVHVSALHMQNGRTIERFNATVNPGKRVPRYVAERVGFGPAGLDDLPPFAAVLDDLLKFLDTRPVIAQDARLTWAFVEAEARRAGQALADRLLIDANELATYLLDLRGKPTLARVAAQLGIGTLSIGRADEEARVLGQVVTHLLEIAVGQGFVGLREAQAASGREPLRTGQTIQALSDAPGVYVLRDSDETPLYVGKARRLRSRVAAYVHRPLGATRHLEGLVSAVQRVDSVECATDLEALILEDREIRRVQPRFNTVRRQSAPRLWIRLPPTPATRPGKLRQLAPPRLELSLGPAADTAVDEPLAVGPFRNETLAAHARLLARRVFGLDTLRRNNPAEYAARLDLAWDFLHGQTDTAIAYARQGPARLLRMVLDFDWQTAMLPADPRLARYAVLRPTTTDIEGFLIDHGILCCWVARAHGEPSLLAAELLASTPPRTTPEDVDIVLRWFGAQRPPACLVHLPEDRLGAFEAIEDAGSALLERLCQGQARPSQIEDAF